MKTSVIRYRVADFLKRHPPFDALREEDLLELAGTGRVTYHQSEEYLYEKGPPKGAPVRVIQQGKVEIVEQDSAGERVRDVLGEGDILGLDSRPYAARTASDGILYSIDAAAFDALVRSNDAARKYLNAHFPAARRTWMDADPPPTELLDTGESSAPAADAGENAGLYFTEMMRTRSTRLRLMKEGAPVAILSDSDLALAAGRNPMALLQRILAARDMQQLELLRRYRDELVAESLASPEDVERCAAMASLLDAASVESTGRLEGASKRHSCWIQFGRRGRGEALASEPASIGIIYADESDGETENAKSLAAWREFYRGLIRDPIQNGIYAARAMFDFRLVLGDQELAARLRESIAHEMRSAKAFIPVLANDTLASLPPMTFFRGVVVELDGQERGTLDLERYALAPIEDAARVFALSSGNLEAVSTLARLKDAPEEACDAFRIASYHCAKARFRNGSAVIDPSRLSKYDQRLLKNAFDAILRLIEFTASRFAVAAQLQWARP